MTQNQTRLRHGNCVSSVVKFGPNVTCATQDTRKTLNMRHGGTTLYILPLKLLYAGGMMPDLEEQDDTLELEINEYEYEDYVDEYYEEEHDEESHEHQVAEGTWGLNPGMLLAREAADWYLLAHLWLDGKDEGKFAHRTATLAEAFADYTDMVVGGELRYTLNHITDLSEIAPELLESLQNEISGERSEAWDGWYSFRRRYGFDALEWAENAFKLFGSHTYGGEKWAYIAHTLKMFEGNEISDTTFVDMCWGLEHNGGQFFGKLWDTYRLQNVLNANLEDRTDKLLENASPAITQLYTEVNE